MDQQTKFKTALAALAASAETKDRKLTKADVKEFLEDMDLGEEQMKLVYAYLASKHIHVEGAELPKVEDTRYSQEEQEFLKIMAPAGRLDAVPESLIDAASCVSGCGPAWVYQFIEALADGGVACGLPRAKAQEYAAQMVLGSAKLVLESGKHPGELKDAVCSPGGSTIQGVRVLEEHGLRGAVMDAVIASYNKTKEMGKG